VLSDNAPQLAWKVPQDWGLFVRLGESEAGGERRNNLFTSRWAEVGPVAGPVMFDVG